jgi:hypothetical protein
MTEREAIARVKANYGYPPDMPDSLWHAQYGSYAHPNPYQDSVDVWEVSSTGAELAEYFIPGSDPTPRAERKIAVYIEDATASIFLARISES